MPHSRLPWGHGRIATRLTLGGHLLRAAPLASSAPSPRFVPISCSLPAVSPDRPFLLMASGGPGDGGVGPLRVHWGPGNGAVSAALLKGPRLQAGGGASPSPPKGHFRPLSVTIFPALGALPHDSEGVSGGATSGLLPRPAPLLPPPGFVRSPFSCPPCGLATLGSF